MPSLRSLLPQEVQAGGYEVNPECLSVEDGIELGVFPASCPNVEGLVGYVPPEEMEEGDGTLVGFVVRVGRLLLRAWRRATPPE